MAIGDEASKALFEGVLAELAHPFVGIDADGIITGAGPRIDDLLGWAPEALVGRHFLDVVATGDRDEAAGAYAESLALAGEEVWQPLTVSIELLRPDDTTARCQVSLVVPPTDDLVVLQLRDGNADALLDVAMLEMGAAEDVHGVLTTLVEAASDPYDDALIAYGWDGEAFATVVGPDHLPPALIEGTLASVDWEPLMADRRTHTAADLATHHPVLAAWADENGYAGLVVVPMALTGNQGAAALVIWRRILGVAMLGTIMWDRVAAVATVAIESHWRRALLERAATIDQLTELENRRALVGRLDRIRTGETEAHQVTALYCDLDGFKEVNDEAGHLVGDRVLAVAAQRLRNAVRPSDAVARVGGDEFAVILVDAPEAMVTALADRLIAAVSRPVEIDGRVHRVGLSVGIATGAARSDPDLLLDRADRALLQAKQAGKEPWVQG